MAIGRSNAKLITPYIDLDIRSWPVDFTTPPTGAMPASLDPDDSDVLRDGEWMAINQDASGVTRAGAGQSWIAANGLANSMYIKPSYMLYAERGRTDFQAIGGGGKVPLIWRGAFEVDTQLYDFTNAASLTVGTRLVVTNADAESGGYANFSVLATHASSGYTVGYVTKAVTNNGSNGLRAFCQAGGFGLGV